VLALLIQSVPPRDDRAMVAGSSSATAGSGEAEAPGEKAPAIKKRERVPIPGPWRIEELKNDASVVIASATMDRRSFITALDEKGVPKAQAYRVIKAFEDLHKFDKCGKKDRFTVAMDRETRRVKAFEYEISPTEIYQAREGEDGLLKATKLDMKIGEEEYTGAFYVGSDLGASYKAGGFEDGLLEAIDDELSGLLSSESFKEGGTVRLIAVEETALGLFSRYKRIIAIEYRPADPAEKPTRVYRFDGTEARGYWDERGRQPHAGGWRSPVPGAPVTSHFNPKRKHPILKKIMPHNGTDFGAPSGTPVYAAYRGQVTFVGPHGPNGNFVAINHPGGIETGYSHLSRFAPGIKVGDKVGVRQLVGYIGTTGRSTGPHLHLSAKKNGKFFDVLTLHLDGDRPVPGVDRQAFLAAKADLDRRIDAIALPEPPPEPVKPAASAAPSESAAASAAVAAPEPSSESSSESQASEEPKPGDAPRPAPGSGAAVIGSPAARASAAAEPGIHPKAFVEDDSIDDGE